MILFFDLEETLITDFDNPQIINVQKVKDFLKTWDISKVNIFSFAIWDKQDRDYFNSVIKPMLEDAFGFKVNEVPTMDEITEYLKKKWTAIQGRDDLFDFFDKERAFIDFSRIKFPYNDTMLVDDRVSNITVKNGLVTGTKIITINVNDIV